MNNNDAIKGSELYLKNHGFDLGKLSQCSSADEIDAIISSTVSQKDAPLFKAIINKSFVPNDDGSFRPFYETNPRTAGDSAEWFDFFRSYGNGTELKKEVHFDLSNYKGRKMNFLGYDEEITNDFRASDLVQQGADSNIHIEIKVGVWGNNLRPRIRQELYADALRLDNDPTSKQEYRIYVNAANGKCLFDDSEQASYLKTMLERYPDRCTVKFNDIKLSPNDIETIISKKERGVLAKDICKKVLDTPEKEVSGFQKSSLGRASSHTGKLFGGIGAAGAASGSSINWGKIITSIIAVLVVLALIVGVVVLLAKILPPVFEAIGQFFVNLWNGICNFFKGVGNFFKGLFSGDTLEEDSSLFIPYEEVKTFNIIYELDGGTNSENNPTTYEITAEIRKDEDGNVVNHFYDFTASFHINTLNIPTKEGYAFVGWYTDPDERIRDVKYGKDVTLYAVWTKINTIKLVYNENDVSEIKFVTDYPCEQFLNQVVNDPNFLYQVTYVDLPVLEDGPNYSFSGWFESADFDCEPTRTIYEEKDYTFYAGFENSSPGLVFSGNFGGIVHYPVNDTENKILIDGYEGTDETVIIPQYYQGYKVAAIGNQAFYYTSAKTVVLSSSIEFIGNWAFIGNSIETVYIPATVKEIDPDAFYHANGLTTIVFDGTKQQWNAYGVSYTTYTDIQVIKCLDGDIVVGN